MRPKLLICLAALIAAVTGPPSLAQPADKDAAPAKAAPADATAVSGLTVAVRRTPSVSELRKGITTFWKDTGKSLKKNDLLVKPAMPSTGSEA